MPSPTSSRSRRADGVRRIAAVAVACAPGVATTGADLALRHPSVDAGYALAAVATLVGWAGLVVAAAAPGRIARGAAIALLGMLSIAAGIQRFTFSHFRTYVDSAALRAGASMVDGVVEEVLGGPAPVIWAVVVHLVGVALTVLLVHRTARSERRHGLVALVVGACAFVAVAVAPRERDVSAARSGVYPPDATLLIAIADVAIHGVAHPLEQHEPIFLPSKRTPKPVGAISPTTAPRSVLVLLTESVRRDAWCAVDDARCVTTPLSQAATPNRHELRRVRSVASTTAIALHVLLSGLPVDAIRSELLSAPLLYEYAHAAGIRTGHFTAQNADFGGAGAFLQGVPLDREIDARGIAPGSPLVLGVADGALVDHVIQELPGFTGAPYVLTVQLASTHFPYRVDEKDSPFGADDRDYVTGLRNRYLNAVHLQDRSVARLVTALRAEHPNTVILFLSDHGESLFEHGIGLHGTSLYDEELAIPFWVDAPPGVLTDSERAQLGALRDSPRTTLDVLPTVLDLLGLLDAAPPKLRRMMPGQSLLRGGSRDDHVVTITNCSELWTCVVPNYGVLRGDRKYIYRQDSDFQCLDAGRDPTERSTIADACTDLIPTGVAYRERQRRTWRP